MERFLTQYFINQTILIMRRIVDYKIICRKGVNPVVLLRLDTGSRHRVDFNANTMHDFVAICSMLQYPYVQFDPSKELFRVISNPRIEEIESEEEVA